MDTLLKVTLHRSLNARSKVDPMFKTELILLSGVTASGMNTGGFIGETADFGMISQDFCRELRKLDEACENARRKIDRVPIVDLIHRD